MNFLLKFSFEITNSKDSFVLAESDRRKIQSLLTSKSNEAFSQTYTNASWIDIRLSNRERLSSTNLTFANNSPIL